MTILQIKTLALTNIQSTKLYMEGLTAPKSVEQQAALENVIIGEVNDHTLIGIDRPKTKALLEKVFAVPDIIGQVTPSDSNAGLCHIDEAQKLNLMFIENGIHVSTGIKHLNHQKTSNIYHIVS
ncbi:hypothetical protein RF11_15834 [Thelohanellus kitauei]|uniref:Uncharacterized protein n=1 Tax=Thelohanellus kitauei TaxID=669202 RepID=A0A0C2MFD5_THEKT|nr:hypothetical protein RF11_15834 [Thelohanellus kitauei]